METHLNIVTLRINSTRPSGVPLEQRVMEPQVALLSPPAGGCRVDENPKPGYCHACRIKNCEMRVSARAEYCF